MATEIVDRWMPTNLEELRAALDDMMANTERGTTEDVVYVDVRDLTLARRTLTDGSVVYDVTFRPNK